MSGIKYLLDTNVILGVLKGTESALNLAKPLSFENCFYSTITRMELLGFSGISQTENDQIESMLSHMISLPIDKHVEDKVIDIRRLRTLKLPDAIIAATALTNEVTLLTLDKKLNDIYEDAASI